MSNKAIAILNTFVNQLSTASLNTLPLREGSKLATYSKYLTMSSREIQTAVHLILRGELLKHTISEGTKSVTKFSSTGDK
jgi:histone H2B